MSVIGSANTVTPNRLLGVFDYIKENPGCEVKSLEELFGSTVVVDTRQLLVSMEWIENKKSKLSVIKDESFQDLSYKHILLAEKGAVHEQFPLFISWLLTFDSGVPFRAENPKHLQQKTLNTSDDLHSNNTQFPNLLNWAVHFGFVNKVIHKDKSYYVIDPTEFFKRNKDVIFPSKAISIKKFLKDLGKKYPIFETGKFRSNIEKRLKKPRELNTISSTTSMALLRLEHQKIIKLERKSDDKDLHIMQGFHNKNYSNIKLVKK